VEYEWDFHDGTTSHEANPTHIFTAPGNFSPILTVRCAGCATTERFSQVTVILPLLDLITPKGDAVTAPVLSGDGQNRFRFSLGQPVLTMRFTVRVIPDSIDLHQIQDRVSFTVDPIGLIFPVWDRPGNPGGRASISGHNLVATATFTGLPTHNRDFGNKLAELKFNDVTVESARTQAFYEATASQHPGGTPGSPNWFYYYQDQEGGTDYVYDPAPDHCRFEVDTGRIVINEHCYPSVLMLEETLVNGRRRFTGTHGEDVFYWRNFIAALGHERGHKATVRHWPADQDPDGDLMSSDFEVSFSTDPNNAFTCDPPPGLFLPDRFNDAECWAYGPPEHDAANSALALDATLDWAHPGMQWSEATPGLNPLQQQTKVRDNAR
jgi:PKD repeat protein